MNDDVNSSKSGRSWFGAFFGLLFVTAGLIAAYMSAGEMLLGYIESANWQDVPVKIQKLELVPKYGDTTTYSVKSSYTYQYNGRTYNGSRVSLSSGSDNIGHYWQDLHRTLQNDRHGNEASALVNPDDPQEAILDRTLRWKALVFGSIFLFLFTGFGAAITWLSLMAKKSHSKRRKNDQQNGITSEQKYGGLFLTAFGSMFFVIGVAISILAIPEELRQGNYLVLLVLLFVFAGALIMAKGFKQHRAFRKIGPTPLFLDPAVPGVGGQLGGTFDLSPATSALQALPAESLIELKTKLSCIRIRRSGKNTSKSVIWHEDSPLYLAQTASGYKGSFIFDIPDNSIPTSEHNSGSSIIWKVSIDHNLDAGIGKFERTWEVVVADETESKTSSLSIPEFFLHKARKTSAANAKVSGLAQIPITENADNIQIQSRAGRDTKSKLIGLGIGSIFFASGIFTVMQNWWPGYILILIGSIIEICSLYTMGKAIDANIDKQTLLLTTQESWMGKIYARKEAQVVTPDQFKIKKTSTMQHGSKITEYYAINVESEFNTIRIADGIKTKSAAVAIRNELAERCFQNEQPLRQAA